MRHSATCVRPPVWRMCARCIGADQGLIMADPLSRAKCYQDVGAWWELPLDRYLKLARK